MSDTESPTIEALARDTWSHHRNFEGRDLVCDPSIPVLYFGDREAYHRSTRKIVTVGLNPSNNEFPPEEPYKRFEDVAEDDVDAYLETLNRYFQHAPFRQWFRSYEKVLGGLGASYYDDESDGDEPNLALHTDLCTPLATQNTWGDLKGGSIRNALIEEGRPIWRGLVDELQPDLILASVARPHLESLPRKGTSGEEVHTITENGDGSEKARPYRVLAWPYRSSGGEEAALVYGQAGVTPFQLITDDQKETVGERLAERYYGDRKGIGG